MSDDPDALFDSIDDDFPDDGTWTCANCDGSFLPEDMDGEHCHACADELFGDA